MGTHKRHTTTHIRHRQPTCDIYNQVGLGGRGSERTDEECFAFVVVITSFSLQGRMQCHLHCRWTLRPVISRQSRLRQTVAMVDAQTKYFSLPRAAELPSCDLRESTQLEPTAHSPHTEPIRSPTKSQSGKYRENPDPPKINKMLFVCILALGRP